MTAKKKRKKLNCSYHGVPRDLVVVPLERSAHEIPLLWAALLSVGFDECPVPGDADPGGEVLTLSSTVKTATNEFEESGQSGESFYVTEEEITQLDISFVKFIKRLFGEHACEDTTNEIKCLKFVSRVGSIAQQREVSWDVVRWNESTLYVHIDSAAFPEGSRASFVQLLEYAEEELQCENVIICFPADHDKRDTIRKTFMFLGFLPMAPGHALIPRTMDSVNKLMFMGYVIE